MRAARRDQVSGKCSLVNFEVQDIQTNATTRRTQGIDAVLTQVPEQQRNTHSKPTSTYTATVQPIRQTNGNTGGLAQFARLLPQVPYTVGQSPPAMTRSTCSKEWTMSTHGPHSHTLRKACRVETAACRCP